MPTYPLELNILRRIKQEVVAARGRPEGVIVGTTMGVGPLSSTDLAMGTG